MDNSENVQLQSRRLASILGSVPLRRHRIPRGRDMGKGTRAPNRGQFTPISGAEAQSTPPPIHKMNNIENIQLLSRRLAPILGRVPLRRHRNLGSRDMGKGTRAPKRGQFTPISGAEAQSTPPNTQYTGD